MMGYETCKKCGCTEYDCTQCIEKTGRPCHWIEDDLCSACVDENVLVKIEKDGFYFKITEDNTIFSSTFYGPTIVWGGEIYDVSSLNEAITYESKHIKEAIINLDKANQGSRRFLKHVLSELQKSQQVKINL